MGKRIERQSLAHLRRDVSRGNDLPWSSRGRRARGEDQAGKPWRRKHTGTGKQPGTADELCGHDAGVCHAVAPRMDGRAQLVAEGDRRTIAAAKQPPICSASGRLLTEHGRAQMDRSGQPRGPCPRPTSRLLLCRPATALCRSGGCSRPERPADAPNQRDGAPRAWIRFDEQVAEGTKDLRPGDEIVVLTWLHLSPRDELSTHPEDDMGQPLTGVFSTCSPNRRNPIGLHRARIVARDGLRIEVDALEAIDGTPVVDVKPAIDPPA